MVSVLTYLGEEWIVDKLTETSQNAGNYVAWGTGAGTAAKGDTTLFTEASESRVTGTVSKVGTGQTAVYQVVGTITADGTKTITNVGLWSASSGGSLHVKADFTGVALVLNDAIQFTITIDPA